MVTSILTIAVALLVPLLKIIFEAINKKKISDKEFLDFIQSHQALRSNAGKASMDWEEAIKAAQESIKLSAKEKNEEESSTGKKS